MNLLFIHIFNEKKWNSNAYLSYHQYHEIRQIFKNKLQFTFGKVWGTLTCSTVLRDTLVKTGDDKNYFWTKVGPNPSRIHTTTNNMILYKNLMFIFSLVQYFSKYCRSKNDHARLSHRISFMNTCSPYASVSANLNKIRTFFVTNLCSNKMQCKCLSPNFVLRFK